MIILISLCVIFVIFLHTFLKRHFKFWERNGVKQLHTNILFGSLYENILHRKDIATITKEHYDSFKQERYFGMYQFNAPVLVLRNPELIKTIAIKEFDSFTDHMNHAKEDVDLLWSKNLLSMRGEKWHDMRSTLSPAFTGSKMRFMFPLINDVAERFVDHFLSKNEDIVTLEMKDAFSRAASDIIASCGFGVQCDSLKELDNEFYLKGRKALNFSGFIRKTLLFMYSACPSVMKFFGLKMFPTEIVTFFRTIISETIAIREEQGVVRPDMIHLLLEARKGRLKDNKDENTLEESIASTKEYSLGYKPKRAIEITDDDITAQAMAFFLAGSDTTSYLMGFVAYELAVHPEIQERLRLEVDKAMEGCGEEITYEALQKMKYLDMIISETLRKWPPAPVTGRLCTKDFIIEPKQASEKRVYIKKGMFVWLPIYSIQRDADIYPEPDRFDPERFSTENRSKMNTSTYIPFGIGPRNCIASRFALMETKAIIYHLLSKFEFVPVKETLIPMVICKKNFNVSAEGGLWLGFKRRGGCAPTTNPPVTGFIVH